MENRQKHKSVPRPARCSKKGRRNQCHTSLHAVNRLVPLLAEDDYERTHAKSQAQTRTQTAPRTGSSKISSLHLGLILLIVLLPFTHPTAVDQLQAGIHVRSLGSHKAFDMEFRITTNLNLTKDIECITNYAKDFNLECVKLGAAHHNIQQKCTALNASIHQKSHQVINELRTMYATKEKR